MRFFLASILLVTACGARTELGGTQVTGGATCAKSPWVVFDYSPPGTFELAAIRADGTDFHLLGIDGFLPSVSPDGASLLYLTSSSDDESLVLRDLASGQTRTIVHISLDTPSSGLGKAAVSPDGKWIAYGNIPDLRIVRFDGSSDALLVPGPYNAGCCPWSYGHPVFSADSSLVCLSTIGILESIHPDGSDLTLLAQDHFFDGPPIYPGFVFPNASLSPDGKKLVAQVACDASELRVFDAPTAPFDPCTTGTKLVETGVSESGNEASNAQWGPTNLIVYNDGSDLFLVDPSGGAKTNLTASVTAGGKAAADPVWAPGCANLP
ncbi:MAG TPA: hypothetical protein VGH28_30400 [Polyangiaceae bacterium]|jgi:hypothetical protein